MRNAGGYGHIICDDPDKVRAFDRYGRMIGVEVDTFSCRHCSQVVFVRVGERPEDIGGLCKQCMGLICPHCVNDGRCLPLERRLMIQEAKAQARRSYV